MDAPRTQDPPELDAPLTGVELTRARSAEDYLVAGRRLGPFMYIGTLSAVVLGGASTIVISTTTIIIALLIVILIVMIAD